MIKIHSYTITAELSKKATLPPYKGSLLRGILGNALKKAISQKDNLSETSKNELFDEIWFGIIKSKLISEKFESINYKPAKNLPLSFVVTPPATQKTSFDKGELLSFKFNIFDKGFIYFHDLWLEAFRHFEDFICDKISKSRIKIIMIKNNFNDKLYYLSDYIPYFPRDKCYTFSANSSLEKEATKLNLKFLSPCKIVVKGKILFDELPDYVLEAKFIERVRLLLLLYSDIDIKKYNHNFFDRYKEHRDLCYKQYQKKAFLFNIVNKYLTKSHTKHRSMRHKRLLEMDGFVGEIDIDVFNNNDCMPLIEICEFMHIGSYTTGGFGDIKSLNRKKEK